ncbi:hypothetical protein D3C80_1367130 [compost metagenome]
MNHAGMLDNIGLGDILLQILLEQALYQYRICSNSAEECCRFKRTGACVQCKMLGIHRNACKQSSCLQRAKLYLLVNVLQQLSNELTCRGGIWLQIYKHRIVDKFLTSAVMIYYHCSASCFNKPWLHRNRRFMRINKHQQRVRRHHAHRLIR